MTRDGAEFDTEQFREAVYRVTKMIPRGYVATYSQIATYVLSPRYARAVGSALKHLPRSRLSEVPWQRVINASGRVSSRGETLRPARQERLLEAEGIVFGASGRVDLGQFRWAGPPENWTPPFREPFAASEGRTRVPGRRSRRRAQR